MKKIEYAFWVIFFLTFIVLFLYIAVSAVYGPGTGMESITTFIS
jgi:hypothetical protein